MHKHTPLISVRVSHLPEPHLRPVCSGKIWVISSVVNLTLQVLSFSPDAFDLKIPT